MRTAVTAAAVIASVATASALYQQAADRADRRRYPPPGRMINIGGGRQLHLMTEGTGDPAVIIVPALADDVTTWIPVIKAAAEAASATVHVYDRAGCGWSDPADGPVTLDTMAGDLHALIASAEIGPCVVAGHSVGGIIARRLYARYPGDVAGILLIDSSHEQQFQRIPWRTGSWKLIKYAVFRQARILGAYRLAVNLGLIGGMDIASYTQNVPAALAPAARAINLSTQHRRTVVREILEMLRPHEPPPPLGQAPVTVITSLAKRNPEYRARWKAMQDELAALSPDSIRIDAGDAGHYVHQDDPCLVVQAIADLVKRSR